MVEVDLLVILMTLLVSFDQILIFPLIKSPEDFPCPEYSKLKKPNLYLLANFKRY